MDYQSAQHCISHHHMKVEVLLGFILTELFEFDKMSFIRGLDRMFTELGVLMQGSTFMNQRLQVVFQPFSRPWSGTRHVCARRTDESGDLPIC